jgi:acetyl-CoA synthetase
MSDASLGGESLRGFGIDPQRAEQLAAGIARLPAELDASARWSQISREMLDPDEPLALHQHIHGVLFANWDPHVGPAPVWIPTPAEIDASRLGQAMDGDYAALHRRSVAEPEAYWRDMLTTLGIVFACPPQQMLDASQGPTAPRWLPGARLNIAASCFAGRDPDQTAIVVQGEGGPLERMSLGELGSAVRRVARALHAAGFEAGDALAIDMPMTAESVVIYLGIVAFGASVVSIADSFAPPEITTRLRIAEAKGIFTQDVIHRAGKTLPLYARVVEAQAPRAVVLAAGDSLAVSLRDGDLAWGDFLSAAEEDLGEQPYVICDATAATNILFSSGTTGDPKAIPWDHVTPIKAAADGWGHHDIRPGDVVAWPTNLGWMMGPWLIYASLLNDAAIALYEGSPVGRGFGQFVCHAGVTMLGVVPSLVKAWQTSECMRGLDWSAIRCFSSTGEASSPPQMHWLMARAGYKPIIEYCGGTEIGGAYITGTVVQPQAPSTFSTAALGCDFVILDDDGAAADTGELALCPPMLGTSSRLLNRDHDEVYFTGMPRGPAGETLRRHGDQVEHLGGGYYRAHGRVDDTMNLAGIKTSSAEIERVCNRAETVRETAAIAVSPADGGPSQLVIYAVLEAGADADRDAIRALFSQAIRATLNPLFKVHDVVIAETLPRTASNKVMRRVLRDQYPAS